MQQFRKAMISFSLSLSLSRVVVIVVKRGGLDGHSFRILCIIHFSRFTDRRLFGRRGGGYIFLLHTGAQLSAQSSLHYYYYLTIMSVIRFSKEKKKGEKLDLTCPFFLLLLLLLSAEPYYLSNRVTMTQVYIISNFRSVRKIAILFSSSCYI